MADTTTQEREAITAPAGATNGGPAANGQVNGNGANPDITNSGADSAGASGNGADANARAADVPVNTSSPGNGNNAPASMYSRPGSNSGQGQLIHPADFPTHPLAVADRIAREIDNLFEGFGLGLGRPSRSWRQPFGFGSLTSRALSDAAHWAPQTEVFERDGQLVVRADLPGLRKEDVHIDVEIDSLVIRGERKSEHEENRSGIYHTERSYGSFYRELPLPEGVNPDEVRATFQNGVLEVTLPAPQPQERRSRRVAIE